MNRVEVFADPVLLKLGPVPLTQTMVTTIAVSLAMVAFAAALRFGITRRPGKTLDILAGMAFEFLDRLVTDVVGRPSPRLTIFSGTLFFFIASCSIIGQLPGVRTPTANLATTSALAILVFLAVPAAGIYTKGVWGYIRHYFRPNPILFPLHVISELSRTLALSVRLFGNMMSGHLIVALLVALVGVLVPTPLMALDLLIGFLQAYIFAVLTTVYVGAAIRVGEE